MLKYYWLLKHCFGVTPLVGNFQEIILAVATSWSIFLSLLREVASCFDRCRQCQNPVIVVQAAAPSAWEWQHAALSAKLFNGMIWGTVLACEALSLALVILWTIPWHFFLVVFCVFMLANPWEYLWSRFGRCYARQSETLFRLKWIHCHGHTYFGFNVSF